MRSFETKQAYKSIKLFFHPGDKKKILHEKTESCLANSMLWYLKG